MSDTFTSEATVQRKLLNSIIPLITHQKIIGAVYKQTTRVVKLSILPFFQTRDITCLPLFQNSVTTTRRSSSKQTSPGISKSPIPRPSFPKVFTTVPVWILVCCILSLFVSTIKISSSFKYVTLRGFPFNSNFSQKFTLFIECLPLSVTATFPFTFIAIPTRMSTSSPSNEFRIQTVSSHSFTATVYGELASVSPLIFTSML